MPCRRAPLAVAVLPLSTVFILATVATAAAEPWVVPEATPDPTDPLAALPDTHVFQGQAELDNDGRLVLRVHDISERPDEATWVDLVRLDPAHVPACHADDGAPLETTQHVWWHFPTRPRIALRLGAEGTFWSHDPGASCWRRWPLPATDFIVDGSLAELLTYRFEDVDADFPAPVEIERDLFPEVPGLEHIALGEFDDHELRIDTAAGDSFVRVELPEDGHGEVFTSGSYVLELGELDDGATVLRLQLVTDGFGGDNSRWEQHWSRTWRLLDDGVEPIDDTNLVHARINDPPGGSSKTSGNGNWRTHLGRGDWSFGAGSDYGSSEVGRVRAGEHCLGEVEYERQGVKMAWHWRPAGIATPVTIAERTHEASTVTPPELDRDDDWWCHTYDETNSRAVDDLVMTGLVRDFYVEDVATGWPRAGRFVYLVQRRGGEADEAAVLDFHVVREIRSVERADDGSIVLEMVERGGPYEALERTVRERVDARCWSQLSDDGDDVEATACLPETPPALPDQLLGPASTTPSGQALVPGDGLEALRIAPAVGLVERVETDRRGRQWTWRLAGLELDDRSWGHHELDPVTCDWDASRRVDDDDDDPLVFQLDGAAGVDTVTVHNTDTGGSRVELTGRDADSRDFEMPIVRAKTWRGPYGIDHLLLHFESDTHVELQLVTWLTDNSPAWQQFRWPRVEDRTYSSLLTANLDSCFLQMVEAHLKAGESRVTNFGFHSAGAEHTGGSLSMTQ